MTVTPPKKTGTLLKIRLGIIFLLLSAIIVYLSFLFSFALLYALIPLFALYLFVSFFYIPRFISSTSVYVSSEGVTVTYGVFIKTEHILPVLRLIFTETTVTPLSRAFGVCSVSFSGVKAKVKTPEILIADAIKITKYIENEKAKGYER